MEKCGPQHVGVIRLPAEKTVDYAEAKTAYFKALRAELPESVKISNVPQFRLRLKSPADGTSSPKGEIAASALYPQHGALTPLYLVSFMPFC